MALSTKKRIMAAAIKSFRAKGCETVSMNQICSCAGINRSSFYNIFKDKDDLIMQILAITDREIQGKMSAFINSKNDFERMWILCDYGLSIALALGPEVMGAIFCLELKRDAGYFQTDTVNRHCIHLYRNCLELGIARHYAAPEELVPLATDLAYQITYNWCRQKGAFPLRDTVRKAIETIYGVLPEFRARQPLLDTI